MDKKTKKKTSLSYRPGDERGLPNNTINALYEDTSGVMWIGTYKKGIAYYDQSIFKFGINHIGDVNCIDEHNDGSIWVGTNDAGLIRWEPKTNKKTFYSIHVFKLYDKEGKAGGLTGTYIPGDKSNRVIVRNEDSLYFEDLNTIKTLPAGFRLGGSKVTYEGEIEPSETGNFKLILYYAGYTKVYIDNQLVVPERWRTACG